MHTGPQTREMYPSLGRLERMHARNAAAHGADGEHDMPDFIEGAQRLVQTLPDARYLLIEGAGHLAPLEAPAGFEDLLREFLGGADS
jgi:pimeloyl-ACP methyl ester carboxylesterase